MPVACERDMQFGLVTRAALVLAAVGGCAAEHTQRHRATYPDGQPRWETTLEHGLPHGPSITYHANGVVASRGTYVHGRREGTFSTYDEQGRLHRRVAYRDGRRIEGAAVADPFESRVPPGRATVVEAEDGTDRYREIRLSYGASASSAARNVTYDGYEVTMDLNLLVLRRRGALVWGGTGSLGGQLFGGSHVFAGPTVGVASPGNQAHAELLLEAGVHGMMGLGNDLFSEGDGRAIRPYAGGQLRFVIDPGEPNHLVFELAVHARRDLYQDIEPVMVTSCFFGCSTDIELYQVGGTTFGGLIGLGYQFD